MRFGESIWIASLDEENSTDDLRVYKKPKEYRLRPRYISLMPVSGYVDIMLYGKNPKYEYDMISYKDIFQDNLKVGDRLYIDGVKPSDNEEYYGYGANAEIKGKKSVNYTYMYDVRKIVCEDE